MSDRTYFVYILASRSRTLYTGVTNDLDRRMVEHRGGTIPGFTHKYRIHRLVYCEPFGDIRFAIAREKQIKSWRREKKIALIESKNPTWLDMSSWWMKPYPRKADSSPRKEPSGLGMTFRGGGR